MAKLKNRIQEEAKRLFAEKGYDAVSLRMIAAEAGTTIGNLTYYFPQKEDLIRAIQEESQANFWEGMGDMPMSPEDTFGYMIEMTKRIHEAHRKNIFYFECISTLCNHFLSIHKNTLSMRKKIYETYLKCFDNLRNHGYMRSDIQISVYNNLAYTLVVMVTSWMQNISLYREETLPHPSIYNAILSIVYPYFTPKGITLAGKHHWM